MLTEACRDAAPFPAAWRWCRVCGGDLILETIAPDQRSWCTFACIGPRRSGRLDLLPADVIAKGCGIGWGWRAEGPTIVYQWRDGWQWDRVRQSDGG